MTTKNKNGIWYELKDRNIEIYQRDKGLNGYEEERRVDIAKRFNLTRGRVTQICDFVEEKYGKDLDLLE
ncbi:MAG: hypothetical protein ACOC44_18915 [Promethearchaeia archaeon]